jgi:hypothetical protein
MFEKMNLKQTYIKDEIWMLTIGGAFQHANVYKSEIQFDDKFKNEFKKELKNFIITISEKYISTSIDDEQHIENIHLIQNFTRKFESFLNGGSLNFGISQKLLNLYLKYLWCLDVLKVAPPHFPVDSIIQSKLKVKSPYPWTKMTDEIEYLKIIQKAKDELVNSEATNLAELELHLFNRRNN